MICAEYIWIGGQDTHTDLRSKTRTLFLDAAILEKLKSIRHTNMNPILVYNELNNDDMILDSIPEWNFDGSSTCQASGDADTEVILKPCALCYDPFESRGSTSIMVLCECYLPNGEPHPTNTRWNAAKIFREYKATVPWFGLEQEYVLCDIKTDLPLGWKSDSEPECQGKYYCGNGADKIFSRFVIEEHYQGCLYAGLNISGWNAEVMPGQYEYQIGPVEGIHAGDQLIFARYIMTRICEMNDLKICYSPKPMKGDWNGSGLHHNFSTEQMREEDGYKYILKACHKLESKHKEHLEVYGADNHLRLTGKHETSSMDKFTWGIGTRNTSVRIPNQTHKCQKGYFEDRRPAANVDPYLSTSKLFLTCVE